MPDETATTVPPFIPGLLIVSLLLFVSLLIGWRSYVRRAHIAGAIEVAPDWSIWDGLEGGMPKLWEVGVCGRAVNEKCSHAGWERIMPLSATRLTPELPTNDQISISQPSPRRRTSFIPARFRRPHFFSPTATSSSSGSVPTPSLPLDRLQVSVLISMPSVSARSKSQRNSLTSSLELDNEIVQKQAQESYLYEDDEEEGAPEVAFGVAVLPWRRIEDGGVHSNISVT